MGINFPSAPTEGQVLNVSPGNSFVYRGGFWQQAPLKTALPKNYVVNPSMLVSQENGDPVSPASNALTWWAADMWVASSGLGAAGSMTSQRGRPSASGGDCVFLTNKVAYTPSGNEYAQIVHQLEGQRCADFGWGTAQAKQGIFRFDCYSNLGGTYSVQIKRPVDGNPTFLAPFTVATNAWQTFEVVVPPPPSGVWATDSTAAIQLSFGFAAGGVFANGVAGWQGTNKVQMAGATNGCSVANISHLIADVGFYLDPYLTGVAPPFEVPTFADELRRCQRYWYRGYQLNGPIVAPNQMRGGNRHPVPMRVTPGASIVGVPLVYDLTVTSPISVINNASNAMSVDFHYTINDNDLTTTRAGINYLQGADNYIALSARM